MTEAEIALAREVVGSKHWGWMKGVLGASGTRYDAQDDRGRPYRIESRPVEYPGDSPVCEVYGPRDDLPDFTDPATQGCLLALVRKAWGKPDLFVMRDGPKSYGVYEPGVEPVCIVSGCLTEAAALVAALLAAP